MRADTLTLTPHRLLGRLHLNFTLNDVAAGQGKTRLNVLEQTMPLKVIRAFEQENGAALVHLHNVSGGILSGDVLDYRIVLEPQTDVQITTTSATRIYRSRTDFPAAVQCSEIHVGADACLEIVPDMIIPFAQSRFRQETHIHLEQGAGLFWWEIVSPGRSARGELFEFTCLELQTAIFYAGAESYPIALENIRLEPALRPLSSPVRLGAYRYSTTFYVCKTDVATADWLTLESTLREIAVQISIPGEVIWGVSTLTAHGLVIRGLGMAGRTLTQGLITFWQTAKQALYGRAAILPRKIY